MRFLSMLCRLIGRVFSLADRAMCAVATSRVQSGGSSGLCDQCGESAGTRAVNGTVDGSTAVFRWQEQVICCTCMEAPCGVADCGEKATAIISGKLRVGSNPSVDLPADFPVCGACWDKIVRFRTQHMKAFLLVMAAFLVFVAFLLGAGTFGHIALGGTIESLGEKLMANPLWLAFRRGVLWIFVTALGVTGTLIEYRALQKAPRGRKQVYDLEVTGSAGTVWKDERVPFVKPTMVVGLIDALFGAKKS